MANGAIAIADSDSLVETDHVVARLDAGHHRRRGRSGIGNLPVVRIGLGEGGEGEAIDNEAVRFAIDRTLLPFIDAGRGYRRDAHAVADEENDVLRFALDRLFRELRLERVLRGGEIGIAALRQRLLGGRGGGKGKRRNACHKQGMKPDHFSSPRRMVRGHRKSTDRSTRRG